ncbi:MAG: IPT/TIG domain-containing protein, partial [Acidimicrobiales bacterium]
GIGLHSAEPSRSSATASGPAHRGGSASTAGGISSGSPLSPTAAPAVPGVLGGTPSTGSPPTSSTAAASGSTSAGSATSASGSTGTQPAPAPPSAAAEAAPSAAPQVRSLSPTQGPATGGTWVTITGINLSGATAVHFGTTAASQMAVEPNGQVRALSPAHLPGSVDVVVTTSEGTSPTTPGDVFDFTP